MSGQLQESQILHGGRKLPVSPGDRVCLVYYDGKPTDITYPVNGDTYRDMLLSIEEGMGTPVLYSEYIDRILNNFVEPWRSKFRDLYLMGRVTPGHLIGDYNNFEDGLKRLPNGIWIYNYGS